MAGNPDHDLAEKGSSSPVLDYGCTEWRISSQRVVDLYDSGKYLWSKEDLIDIEQQLEHSATLKQFTVNTFDGRRVHIKNPGYGAKRAIWKPFVSYQDYWALTAVKPDGSPDVYYCTYLVDWKNHMLHDFRGDIQDWDRLFETKRQLWNASITCESFKRHFRAVLDNPARKVTKILCFGLGDMARRPPPVLRLPFQPGPPPPESESEGADVHSCMLQHAVALTMAEEARRQRGNSGGNVDAVRLLVQDPQYKDSTKSFLLGLGFEIVGEHGSGGFAEVDDDTVVFSAWPPVPVKQIVADLARPAVFITLIDDGQILTALRRPLGDTDSPRTRYMWQSYDREEFPISPVEIEFMKGLHTLQIYSRRVE